MIDMYKTFAAIRTEFLALFLLVLGFSFQAQAASALFTVSDVKVDVTAESALKAREQAFAQAQVQAFETLAGRMLSDYEAESFIAPEAEIISSLIQDFEVTKEQLSAVRYVGTYTFRFKDKAVKQFFSGQGVRYSDVSSKPVLVLPFYQKHDRTLLWSPYNLWRNAWNRAEDLQSGLVPIVVPLGDLADASDIDDNEALEYDQTKLNRLIKRYGAGEAALLIATPSYELVSAESDNDRAEGDISVFIYRTDRRGPEFVQDISVRARSGESAGELLDRAAREVKKALQRNWKDQTVVSSGSSRTLRVRAKFENLQQWAETQTALKKVYGLSNTKIVSLSPQEASLDLTFQGDEQRLRLALKQADFTLTTPRINGGLLASEDYRSGRYDRSSVAPLVYDLYLNKYAPREIQPIHHRRLQSEIDAEREQLLQQQLQEQQQQIFPSAGETQPEYVQPQAGEQEQKPLTYEEIRRRYRRQF